MGRTPVASVAIVVVVVVVVVTALVPSAWAETGSGSLTQKIRRESRESDKYWPDEVGITDQQIRQLLAKSLSNSISSVADHLRDGNQGYLYGNRLGDAAGGLAVDESEEAAPGDDEVTPRGSTQRASKRNGFFYGKRNGFFYGKRSGSTATSANECPRCGPQNSGQCVMFGTCCSYSSGGCFLLTKEALPCVTSIMSSPCQLKGEPCGTDGYGRCVADSVCCSPPEGACRVDTACSKPTY